MDYSRVFDTLRELYANLSYYGPLKASGGALLPLRYFFELTYRCNLNCPYCYVGEDRAKDELTLSEWEKVIGQIPPYALVTLVGGEPLVRKDFKEILHKVARRTFGKVNVVSNGILIDDDTISAFLKSKMLLLSVSLDGWGENHDKNRGKEGIFDKVAGNLERLNTRRKGSRLMVDIKTIILENNLADLPKLYKYCCDSGFEFFSLSFLRNNNLKQNSVLRDEFTPEFWDENYPIEPYFDMEHFEAVWGEIENIHKMTNGKCRIRFSPKFEGADALFKIKQFFKTPKNTLPRDIYYPCKYPYSNMMINPQGDVYPCLSVKMGNVRQLKIGDVFNVPKFRHFRKNLRISGGTLSACQMCCEITPKILMEKK